MGFVKSFAKTVSDIVDVELQILPSLIGGLLTGGVGGLLLSGALSSTQAVLSRISPEEFKAEGFTIEVWSRTQRVCRGPGPERLRTCRRGSQDLPNPSGDRIHSSGRRPPVPGRQPLPKSQTVESERPNS